MLHGDCLTVTGETMAENVASFPDLTPGQKVIYPLDAPLKPSGPLYVLTGNLAPEGAVCKLSGLEVKKMIGPARPPLKYERGVLYKYARLVSSASKGAVTD